MKLFVEDLKGYMDCYTNVYRIKIKKINNKNTLIIYYNSLKQDDLIELKEVRLAFLIDENSLQEYFRYEK